MIARTALATALGAVFALGAVGCEETMSSHALPGSSDVACERSADPRAAAEEPRPPPGMEIFSEATKSIALVFVIDALDPEAALADPIERLGTRLDGRLKAGLVLDGSPTCSAVDAVEIGLGARNSVAAVTARIRRPHGRGPAGVWGEGLLAGIADAVAYARRHPETRAAIVHLRSSVNVTAEPCGGWEAMDRALATARLEGILTFVIRRGWPTDIGTDQRIATEGGGTLDYGFVCRDRDCGDLDPPLNAIVASIGYRRRAFALP